MSEANAIFARNVLEFKLKLNLLNQVSGEVDKEVFEENEYSTLESESTPSEVSIVFESVEHCTQECETTPPKVSKESKVSVVSEILETTPSKKCNEKEKDSTNDEEKLLIDLGLYDDFVEDETDPTPPIPHLVLTT